MYHDVVFLVLRLYFVLSFQNLGSKHFGFKLSVKQNMLQRRIMFKKYLYSNRAL